MRIHKALTAALFGTLLAFAPALHAEDIDIFVGSSGGTVAAPNIMILLDNMNNWVSDTPNGKSKIVALKNLLNSITNPVNVGLAMFSRDSPSGAYIRFAPRDVSVAANRDAFKRMLDTISEDARVTLETGNAKDESAALFEIWRFFKPFTVTPLVGLSPKTGTQVQNIYADKDLNTSGFRSTPSPAYYATAYSAFLANTPSVAPASFAFTAGGLYNTPAPDCSKSYIVYVAANNGSPNDGAGSRTYTGAGSDAATTYDAGAALVLPSGTKPGWVANWAKYLFTSTTPITTYVIDAYYPVDNQDIAYSKLLQQVAKQGGGSYKAATDSTGTAIQNELLRIFAEIQSVNSTFASASLPINATNRSQNVNEVFIGMFRPDPDAKPRWFGNLKKYKLAINSTDGSIDLVDSASPTPVQAVNPLTGFVADCATSFFTTDSGTYWSTVSLNPSPAGKCPASSTPNSPFSDAPDGPQVEKGGVAEVIRRGNNPPATTTTATFNPAGRTLYTTDSSTGALVTFNAANVPSGTLATATLNFMLGQDVNDERNTATTTMTRPSIHGDVVHSRPLPVNYGCTPTPCTPTTVVYYGSNDGTFRAVDAATGKERWGYLGREHFSKFTRLKDQSPFVKYPNQAMSTASVTFTPATDKVNWTTHGLAENASVAFTPAFGATMPAPLVAGTQYFVKNIAANDFEVAATSGGAKIDITSTGSGTISAVSPAFVAKDYGFDGSIGLFQNTDSTKTFIYPVQRRGGRMVYSINVSSPTANTAPGTPALLWQAGCPNLTNNTGCVKGATTTTELDDIGQTWSLPAVAFVKGYSDISVATKPVVIFGGGYDSCEDANSASPSCGSANGRKVYVIDATNGPTGGINGAANAATNTLFRSFGTDRSVVADVALVDVDNDGNVDYAYVVDTGGSIYRVNFRDPTATPTYLAAANWTITKIAYTTGSSRKFLFAPALLLAKNASGGPVVYIAVGTGDREHPIQSQYPYTTPVVNRFYVFKDDFSIISNSSPSWTGAINLDTDGGMLNKTPTSTNTCLNEAVGPTSARKGWLMDLSQPCPAGATSCPTGCTAGATVPCPGEQTVTSPLIVGGLVFFSTNRPIPSVAGSCSTSLGEARGYSVNLLNASGAVNDSGLGCGGSRSNTFAGGGLPPSPVFGQVVISTPSGDVVKPVCIGCISRTDQTNAPIKPSEQKPPINAIRKRLYWYTPGTEN